MTLGNFRIVIGETTPKERYLLPQKRIIIIRICKEFAFESENFAQKNERSLSEVLIGVYKRSWLQNSYKNSENTEKINIFRRYDDRNMLSKIVNVYSG
jgi:hypothetical protein